MNLLSSLWTHADKQPHKTLYTFIDNQLNATLTFSEFDYKAAIAGGVLQEYGACPGDRVLIVLPQSLNYLMAFFGCLYAHLIAVPVYPPARANQAQRIYHIITDAQAKFVIADTATIELLQKQAHQKNLAEIIYIDIATMKEGKPANKVMPQADTIAFLQYTSGSTGHPKGVIVQHQHLQANFNMMQAGLCMDADSRVVSWLPLFHDMGLIGAALQVVHLGASLYLMSPLKFIRQPLAWLETISHYRGTHAYGPNFAYDMCVEEADPAIMQKLDLSSWRLALNGAEPIRLTTLQRFVETFKACGLNPNVCYPAFGMAEATLYVASNPILTKLSYEELDVENLQQGHATLATKASTQTRTLVNCGKPWLESEILIVDPNTLQPLPARTVGELWIRGPHICAGYWGKAELTTQTFAAFTQAGKGPYLRTGDLAYINEQGELFITGRLKDLIIIRGKNYAPQDIEQTVESFSELIKSNSVAAFSVESEQQEHLIVVIEIRARLTAMQAADLIKQLRKHLLVEYNITTEEIILTGRGGVSKTTSGKLQRQLCKKNYLNNQLPLFQPIEENLTIS
jgi:acyl-CoA synthetase (AMP-forming)/AMP-acid ligase II